MNKKIAGLVAAVCLILTACGDKNSVPSGILPREKMEQVMWDMVMADQYASYLAKDSAHLDPKTERLRLYEQVFRMHDISRDKFQKSYAYYMDHPELNQVLFDSLVDYGSRVRSDVYSHPAVKPLAIPAPAVPVVNPKADSIGKGKRVTPPVIRNRRPSSAPAGKRLAQ